VGFFVHENWRWQTPIRAVKDALQTADLGRPFRAGITFANSFPVFDNQPFLAELEQFIVADIGSHVLDTARFLFGEAESVYCQTARIHPQIRGEDVATVSLRMASGAAVTCEMSYASRTETEAFPQTCVHVECERGAVTLSRNYRLAVTTAAGTDVRHVAPPHYDWADPAYDLVHSSIVPCNADILAGLQGGPCETTGEDNLRTVRLVFAAYESARTDQVVST
jgi:predicted dehydrogenase